MSGQGLSSHSIVISCKTVRPCTLRTTWSKACSTASNAQAANGAMHHLCKQEAFEVDPLFNGGATVGSNVSPRGRVDRTRLLMRRCYLKLSDIFQVKSEKSCKNFTRASYMHRVFFNRLPLLILIKPSSLIWKITFLTVFQAVLEEINFLH